MTTEQDNFDKFVAGLNPKTAESFRKATDIKNELLPTPSLGLNMAIGGLGYGRFTTLYGNKGAGKSLFAMQCVREAQKQGKNVAWIDVEKNVTPEWARRLGVDTDRLYVDSKTISIASVADKGQELILGGADVLVIDSISQLLPQSYFEDAKGGGTEIKKLAETQQIGTFSKNIGQMINILNAVNEKTAIILISQVRNQIGSYGASIGFMGGKALEHANSTTLKFWTSPSNTIEKDVHVGAGLLLKRPVGTPVTWTVEKNRGPGMSMSNTYDIYYHGDEVGVDLTGEVVTYGIEYGVIGKAGNWLKYGDMEKGINGRAGFITYLKDNPNIQQEIYDAIISKYS